MSKGKGRVRFPLRWRILLFTALPPLVLTAATLWTVNRTISQEVRTGIQENLTRSSLVFENILAARASKLGVAAHVIARDPRFFSILAIGGSSGDPHYRVTVERVARAFDEITTSDLFEVVDRRNATLASVGRAKSNPAARAEFVKDALQGRDASGILVVGDAHYQVTVVPVRADGRVTGALLLGAAIDGALAHELQMLTHSEVTFLSGPGVTGSSFANPGETDAARVALERSSPSSTAGSSPLIEVQSGGHIWLTLARAIPGSDVASRQLYVMQRSLDEETAFLREMKRGLFNLGLMAALAALLAGIMVAERITRPVQRLVRGAEEMERGNYEYPLGRTGGDEIGYLSERFQEMREHERNFILDLRESGRQKTEFITKAGHELRTPIAVLKSYHELLSNEDLGPLTPKQRDAMEKIENSVGRLERLAEQTTLIAELESGPPTLETAECRVAELLEIAASTAVDEGKGRQVAVHLDVPDDFGPIVADRSRLTEAVTNLVRNGIRFTPDGGNVHVTTVEDGDTLVIEVADDGVGIPAERVNDLFTRPHLVRSSQHHHSSSTLEFNSAGLGLGLSIARRIVEAHGGHLSAANREGGGSTFTIRIPWRHPEAQQLAA